LDTQAVPRVPLAPQGRGWLGREAEPGEGMSLDHAKKLRSNMTDAERRLWYRLRGHRFAGYKFKRQVPIGPYIVDFACLNHGLVVELDGGQHSESASDAERDEYLRSKSLRILRFWNHEALRNTDAVLAEILATLRANN
jgi:very-short-patch-repair endonuclease